MAGALAWVSNDAERVDALVDECGFAAAPFVGLDVEWTPSFVRGQAERPALLLRRRGFCVLVRINQMAARGAGPPRLRASSAPTRVGWPSASASTRGVSRRSASTSAPSTSCSAASA